MSDGMDSEPRDCKECGVSKPWTKEYFRWRSKYGPTQPCRECHLKNRRQRYATDPKYKMRRRQYTKDNKEKVLQWKRGSYLRHAPRILAKSRQDYQVDPTRKRERSRNYRNIHPKASTIAVERYRARVHALPNQFEQSDLQQALDYFQGCCAYCGKLFGLFSDMQRTMDHFIPVTALNCPGTVPGNILPACRSCNSSKHDKDPDVWLVQRFGKRKAKSITEQIRGYFKELNKEDCDVS